MLADLPEFQNERLAELASFNVLDTESEDEFDSLVALVAKICDVPIALVSLVDKDRQWFKARVGFDGDQTPLEQSVCSHAILDDQILEIPDMLEDRRTVDNPLCVTTDRPLRFYAGVPLVTKSGHKLGTLCVLDHTPRTLTPLQQETLEVLALQVMRQLELRRALMNEAVLRAEIDHRVKNSLQTVMSFVRLYASRSDGKETKDALDAIGRRVSAIAQLHNELYQTNEFDKIRLDRYLTRVANLLQGSASSNVTIKTEVATVFVDSRTAATLAMIVSEFCANAIKHAFPDGRKGDVHVTLDALETDGFQLVCRDNGVGDTRALAHDSNPLVSIGKRLMESAADQIGGDMILQAGRDGYELRLVKQPRKSPPEAFPAGAP